MMVWGAFGDRLGVRVERGVVCICDCGVGGDFCFVFELFGCGFVDFG